MLIFVALFLVAHSAFCPPDSVFGMLSIEPYNGNPVTASWTLYGEANAVVWTGSFADSPTVGRCIPVAVLGFVLDQSVGRSRIRLELDDQLVLEEDVLEGNALNETIHTLENTLEIDITPDRYPEEITWELFILGETRDKIADGDVAGASLRVPAGIFELVLTDSFGDGICCDYGSGSYSLSANNNVFVSSPGDFDFRKHVYFNISDGVGAVMSSDGFDAPTSSSYAKLTVSIIPDAYPSEVSWFLNEASNGTVLASGLSNGGQKDLVDGNYHFVIHDEFGDGICCQHGNGIYTLYTDEGVFFTSGGNYGFKEEVWFGVSNGSIDLESVHSEQDLGQQNAATSEESQETQVTGVAIGVLSSGLVVGVALYKYTSRKAAKRPVDAGEAVDEVEEPGEEVSVSIEQVIPTAFDDE